MRKRRLALALSAGLWSVAAAQAQPVEYEVLATTGQLGPGMPPGWRYTRFDQPFVDELGRVTFLAQFNSGQAVYRTTGVDPQVLVRTGETPPGYEPGDELGSIRSLDHVNRAGDVGLEAWIEFGDSSPTLLGTWTYKDDAGLRGVSFGGLRAPGTTSVMCSGQAHWYEYLMSNAGHVAIFNHLCGTGGNNRQGIWASDENGENLRLVILENRPTEILPDTDVAYFRRPQSINSQGTVVFDAFLEGDGITEANDYVYCAWSAQSGFSVVAREGDPVPGFPPTVTYKQIEGVRVNDLGHTMILATVEGPGISEAWDQVILSDRDGNGLEHVYREGMQAPQQPPGATISYISDVYFNNKSQIAFMSRVAGNSTYFWSEGGPPGLTFVARTGQPVPGFDEPYVLTSFQTYETGGGYGPEPVFTDSGRVVFLGEISTQPTDPTDTRRRFYISDAAGELRDILPPGTELDVSSVPGSPDIRTVDGKSFRLAGSANDADQVAVLAYFTDDSSAVVLVSYADACLADVNGDGIASPADFSAWVAAYNASASGCDQNGDGQCTPADFSAWVINYNNGC